MRIWISINFKKIILQTNIAWYKISKQRSKLKRSIDRDVVSRLNTRIVLRSCCSVIHIKKFYLNQGECYTDIKNLFRNITQFVVNLCASLTVSQWFPRDVCLNLLKNCQVLFTGSLVWEDTSIYFPFSSVGTSDVFCQLIGAHGKVCCTWRRTLTCLPWYKLGYSKLLGLRERSGRKSLLSKSKNKALSMNV